MLGALEVEDVGIPTEADWGQYATDLDQESAHQIFAGKSIQDVLPLFRANVLERASELSFMPSVPFRYYVLAFKEYVLSGVALEDECDAADAANSFLNLVDSRLHDDPQSIAPVIGELLPAVGFVAMHQETYHAPVSIYGTFTSRLGRITEAAGRLTTR